MLSTAETEPTSWPLPPDVDGWTEGESSAGAERASKYYRARYYDPRIGRFISEDPIGFEGGINFYAYVENNPVNLTDPFGECPMIRPPWIRPPSMRFNPGLRRPPAQPPQIPRQAPPDVTNSWLGKLVNATGQGSKVTKAKGLLVRAARQILKILDDLDQVVLGPPDPPSCACPPPPDDDPCFVNGEWVCT